MIINRISNKYKSNNEYKESFDNTFKEVWEEKYTSDDNKQNEELWYYTDCIQTTLLILGILFVFGGYLFIQVVDKEKISFLNVVILGVLFLFLELIVFYISYRKTGYYDKEIQAIEDTFNRMVDGFKDMRLADKLAEIDVFDLKYKKAPIARFSRCAWPALGLLFQTLHAYLGISRSHDSQGDIPMGKLMVWIALTVALSCMTAFFASGKAFNIGHYKRVTVKYRNWLLDKR